LFGECERQRSSFEDNIKNNVLNEMGDSGLDSSTLG
jgi:hypothetical protein